MVGVAGLEPARHFCRLILSQLREPFRHTPLFPAILLFIFFIKRYYQLRVQVIIFTWYILYIIPHWLLFVNRNFLHSHDFRFEFSVSFLTTYIVSHYFRIVNTYFENSLFNFRFEFCGSFFLI